jgi:hypothetical protein
MSTEKGDDSESVGELSIPQEPASDNDDHQAGELLESEKVDS